MFDKSSVLKIDRLAASDTEYSALSTSYSGIVDIWLIICIGETRHNTAHNTGGRGFKSAPKKSTIFVVWSQQGNKKSTCLNLRCVCSCSPHQA